MAGLGNAEIAPDPSWTVTELIEHAEGCGALSAAWLPALAAVDPAALEVDLRLDYALVMQRMTAVVDALALNALAVVPSQFCRPPSPGLIQTDPAAAKRVCPGGVRCTHHWEADQFSALTGLPPWVASHRRNIAAHLDDDWAPLAPLLAAGRITAEHLKTFDRATLNANPEATAAAVQAVLDLIAAQPGPWAVTSITTLRRTARRAVAAHTAPDEALRTRKKTTAEETGISFEEHSDGLATLGITGDTHKLEAIRTMLAEHITVTRPAADDTRTRGQRQVDLLVALCLHSTGLAANPLAPDGRSGDADDSADSSWPGSPFTPATPGGSEGAGGFFDTRAAAEPAIGVIITASLETLIGLSNEPGLVGDTIVSAAVIRQWAADPAWARRAVTDDHGLIRTISRQQRHPARRLRMAVQARWQRCTFPGCPQPARQAQIDHAHDHARGGPTDLANLHPLCPRHHRLKDRLKDQPGTHLRLTADGTAEWTFPNGRTISVPAPDHRVKTGPHDGIDYTNWDQEPPPPTHYDYYSQEELDEHFETILKLDPELQPA